eukprot:s2766_g7.t1
MLATGHRSRKHAQRPLCPQAWASNRSEGPPGIACGRLPRTGCLWVSTGVKEVSTITTSMLPVVRAMASYEFGCVIFRLRTKRWPCVGQNKLLLRRLHLPLPLSAARCRCRALHDHCGDHLAACPRSGLLRARGGPVERAAARICREAGATVALNVLVRDLNVNPVRQDDRRIEAIANDRLLQRIPHLDDLQAAWLLLQSCAAPRANYQLPTQQPMTRPSRSASPTCSSSKAPSPPALSGQPNSLKGSVGWACAVPAPTASSDRRAAHLASWCDTLPVVQARAPAAAERLLCVLRGEGVLPCATAAILARQHLCDCGFDAPEWSASPALRRPDNPAVPCDRWPFKGWQRLAAHACDKRA